MESDRKGSEGFIPGVVKRTDLVGVERNKVTFLVTVIGGIGSNEGWVEREE